MHSPVAILAQAGDFQAQGLLESHWSRALGPQNGFEPFQGLHRKQQIGGAAFESRCRWMQQLQTEFLKTGPGSPDLAQRRVYVRHDSPIT
jgi:hypothetical protein